MTSRSKRSAPVKDRANGDPHSELNSLEQLRNAWEFAALCQYLNIFGSALKLPDSWHIEDLEKEILMTSSQIYIPVMQMAMLRNIFSHKIISNGQFDEYTRRLYQSKKPSANPFGEEENPLKFTDLPFLTKAKVLHQLSQWTLIHPERLREKLEENSDKDQQQWRMEPCGFDAQENTYFLLDDNRLYRRTAMTVPPTSRPSKATQRKTSRPSKRRKISKNTGVSEGADENEESPEMEMLNSTQWSCICANMEQWLAFVEKLKKSRHPDEKELYKYITIDVMPILEKAEEERRKAMLKKQKELALEAAVANRKRSRRVEAKLARQREEEERLQLERKTQEELHRFQCEAAEREKISREREKRLMVREKRLKEREMRLAAGQQNLNKGAEDESDSIRRSSRRRNQVRGRKEWMFDCICGVHGLNYDDGSQQVACDRCEIWQHVACLNLPPDASGEDKEFVCERCLAREREILNSGVGVSSGFTTTSGPHRMTIKLHVSSLNAINGVTHPSKSKNLKPIKTNEVLIDPESAKHQNGTTLSSGSYTASSAPQQMLDEGEGNNPIDQIANESPASITLETNGIQTQPITMNLLDAPISSINGDLKLDSNMPVGRSMALASSTQLPASQTLLGSGPSVLPKPTAPLSSPIHSLRIVSGETVSPHPQLPQHSPSAPLPLSLPPASQA